MELFRSTEQGSVSERLKTEAALWLGVTVLAIGSSSPAVAIAESSHTPEGGVAVPVAASSPGGLAAPEATGHHRPSPHHKHTGGMAAR